MNWESSNILLKSSALLIFFGDILRDLPPVEKGVKFYVLMGLTYRFDIYIAIGQEPAICPCFMRLFFGTFGVWFG